MNLIYLFNEGQVARNVLGLIGRWMDVDISLGVENTSVSIVVGVYGDRISRNVWIEASDGRGFQDLQTKTCRVNLVKAKLSECQSSRSETYNQGWVLFGGSCRLLCFVVGTSAHGFVRGLGERYHSRERKEGEKG